MIPLVAALVPLVHDPFVMLVRQLSRI